MSKPQRHIADIQDRQATAFYHSRYVNEVFLYATKDMSIKRANKLLDDAMAICGSPYYKLSWILWSPQAIAFLELFSREE